MPLAGEAQVEAQRHTVLVRVFGWRITAEGLTAQVPAPDGDIALRVHHHRHAAAARQQQRLVADHGGIGIGQDKAGIGGTAAIAAADDAGAPACSAQLLDQGQRQRRLAGAADGDVAHHQHRHRGAVDSALARQEARALALHHATVQPL